MRVVLRPGQRFGPYRLGGLISRGGMGEVWRARKLGPGGWSKTVALKLVLPSLDEQRFTELFLGEARLAAMLDHSNIVAVTGFGREQGLLYLEMEFVFGRDLRHLLERGRLPPQLALYAMAETLKGLAYAHERRGEGGRPLGIVHRDVKPHNVLVSFEGAVKLTDFGIAKATAETGASRSEIKGTAGYMAPEILDGKPASVRSDLFAVGLVLWEALTGRRLFDGETEAERIRRAYECKVPRLAEEGVPVGAQVEEIVSRLLARDPAGRYGSAAEALSALLAAPGGRGATSVELKAAMARAFPGEAAAGPPVDPGDDGDLDEGAVPEAIEDAPAVRGGAAASSPSRLPETRTPGERAAGAAAGAAGTGTLAGEARETGLATRLNRSLGTPRALVIVAALAAVGVIAVLTVRPGSKRATGATSAVAPSADGAVTAPLPAPAPAPATAVDAAATDPAPPRAATARLVIEVEPTDATVSVDGLALAGASPFSLDELAPGARVSVRIERSGYVAEEHAVAMDAPLVKLPVKLTPRASGKKLDRPPPPPPAAKPDAGARRGGQDDGVLLPEE